MKVGELTFKSTINNVSNIVMVLA